MTISMNRGLKNKLEQGKAVVGPFIKAVSPALIEIIGLSGMDYVLIDLEHSPVSMEELENLLRAADSGDVCAFVRVAGHNESDILHPLDKGAGGLLVPMVSSGESAERIVHFSKFAPQGERGMDIYSRLLRDRIIFLGTPIDDAVANTIIAQLLLLTSEDAEADINMYVNSPGGSVSAGLAVYDTMQYVPNDVATTCVGLAASMGSVILAGGAKGKRSALPNSTVLLHQPSQGFEGFVQAADLEIRAREIGKVRDRIDQIFVEATGQSADRIHADSDRDFYLTAEEARDYGLIDQIVKPRTALADDSSDTEA